MSKRDDIKAELDALGVEYNARLGEKKLQEVLDEAKKEEEAPAFEATPEGVSEPEDPQEEEATKDEGGIVIPDGSEIDVKGKEAKVFSPDAQYIRTYSEAVHGKEYLKLAQQYANKIGGLVK